MEEKLAKRGWHDELLASGILGVLKAWIEPLPDGNLPNIKASDHAVRAHVSFSAVVTHICGAVAAAEYNQSFSMKHECE